VWSKFVGVTTHIQTYVTSVVDSIMSTQTSPLHILLQHKGWVKKSATLLLQYRKQNGKKRKTEKWLMGGVS